MIRILAGAAILVAIFAALFGLMAKISGWRVATAVWAVSLALIGALLVAVWLITGDLS